VVPENRAEVAPELVGVVGAEVELGEGDGGEGDGCGFHWLNNY